MRKFVAVVPVRSGSQRVKDKNFRPFHNGKSLLQIKIDQLKVSKNLTHIYISSDCELARKVAADNDVGFLERTPYLCSSEVRWSDVIAGVCETVPGEPLIAWCHTTSPLFDKYDEAIEKFNGLQESYDSLVTVSKYQGFLLSASGRPINYSFGSWHDYSQDLEPLFQVTGALFLGEKQNFIKWRYVIGVKPYLMETDPSVSIDIDTNADFEKASELMKKRGL